MKPKTIVTAVLLLFVAAAVVAAVVRGFGPDSPPEDMAAAGKDKQAENGTGQKGAEEKAPEPIADGVIAFYFHGNQRCPTCKTIEACARKAVHEGFAAELEGGRLQWLVFNYDQPEHAHFKKDYGVATPMVVLVLRAGGKDVKSVNMIEVWPLVIQGDTEGCVDYVRTELKGFLEGPGG